MSYGLQVQNSSGDLVIDHDFRNYEIADEGTATHAGTGIAYVKDVTFASSSVPPLVFVRSTAQALACVTLIRSGGNYTTARFKAFDPFATFDFDWFIARPIASASADTWGLHVFDASGNRVYDSGRRYLQIRDVVSVNLDTLESGTGVNGSGYYPFTHASVSGAFYCLSSMRGFISSILDEVPFTIFPAVRAYSATEAWVGLAGVSFSGSWSPDPYTRQVAQLVVATKSP
jgi:hypothetical protein